MEEEKIFNTERVLQRLEYLSRIGKENDGAVTRLAFSEEYRKGVRLVEQWMRQAGLETIIDPVGNLIGTRKGINAERGVICIGSHLDTVKKGGVYDGALGVLSAIECIQMFNENHIRLDHTLWVSGFNAEEGGPLGGTFGSRAMLGLVDTDGKKELLERFGLTEERVRQSVCDYGPVQCYLELHIEQGGRLEAEKKNIGVVSGIVGITRMKLTAVGESNHAGTTGMEERKDALVAMARLIVIVNETAKEMGNGLVATIGEIEIEPNMANVIPGRAQATLEVRSLKQSEIKKMIHRIEEQIGNIKEADISIEITVEKPASLCSQKIMNVMEEVCKKKQIPYKIMSSGAGHDANAFAHKVPVGMIFVPSKGGKSHCKEEFTSREQIECGGKVLYNTLLKLDESS